MKRIHAQGAKGYVTLNTLVFDGELAQVERVIRAAATAGVDALIVQDLGVLKIAQKIAPELPLHASTQMTCTDPASVRLATELGAARVVLARELSIQDIQHIREQTQAELEVFVHGALCVAYSGQCLTSEAIGGRSANRGACAQACRLPYRLVVDGQVQDSDAAYLLSPEDLEASAWVSELAKLGVASLKIEGRLKGPEYVASTTRLYRAAVDSGQAAEPVNETLRTDALQSYSRGSGPGFFEGANHQRLVDGRTCDHRGIDAGEVQAVVRSHGKTWIQVQLRAPLGRGMGVLVEGGFAGAGEVGGRVWLLSRNGRSLERAGAGERVDIWLGPDKQVVEVVHGRRLFITHDPAVTQSIRARTEKSPYREGLALRVGGTVGASMWIEAHSERGLSARVLTEENLQKAERRPLNQAVLEDKLGQLGASPYRLTSLTSELPADVMLPLSALKRARRALVTALADAGSRGWPVTSFTAEGLADSARPPNMSPPPGGLFVLCRNLAQAEAAHAAGADGIYLDFLELTGTKHALDVLRQRGVRFVGLAPPRIRKPTEEKTERYLRRLEPDAMLVRGLSALFEFRESSVMNIGDFSLNVANRLAAEQVMAQGLSVFTPSFDLNAKQLMTLLHTPFGPFAEVVIHHPMPLFHMEHCVFAALLSDGKDWRDCGRPCERHEVALEDRAGMRHPLEADVGCRNTVFHAAPQSAAELIDRVKNAGVRRFRIELVRQSPQEVTQLVSVYREVLQQKRSAGDAYRSLRTERGYGVVRGSLRIL